MLNTKIIELLEILKKVPTIENSISIENDALNIVNFISVDTHSLKVNDVDLESKIISTSPDVLKENVQIENLDLFINQISRQILRLNHVGISYWCKSIEEEIAFYKEILKDSQLELYEEESGNKSNRWFFIGNKSNWENPLFEIVLNQSKTEYVDEWIPHFHIDIDTILDYSEIKSITNSIFGEGFITWNIDVPHYGVVLGMGSLGSVNGTKIYLGLGTKLRDTKYHREVSLNQI